MTENPEAFHLIFEDGDPLRAGIVKSALESGGIDCFVQNEGVQNLFAMGSVGGLNPLMGTVKVYIRVSDRPRAEALLADLQAPLEAEREPAVISPESTPEAANAPGKGFLSLLRQWFLK